MFGSKKTTPDQSPSQEKQADFVELGRQFAKAWADEIKQACNEHLLEIATSEQHHAWDEAERIGDLQKVIMLYCAAVDGTEEYTNKIFAKFEEKSRELNLPEMIDYTRICCNFATSLNTN